MATSLTRFFADRSVGSKILTAVAAASLVGVTVGGVAVVKMSGLASEAQALYAENVVGVQTIADLESAALRTRMNVLNLLVAQSEADMADYEKKIAEQDATFDELLATYTKIDGGEHPTEIEQVRTGWEGYRAVRDAKLVGLAKDSKVAEFDVVRKAEANAPADEAFAAITALLQDETKGAKASAERADATADGARTTVLAVLVLGLAAAVGLALFVARLITRPLARVNEVLSAVADGDLTQTAPVDSKDEVGVMAGNVNKAAESIRTTVSTLTRSAQALGGSSEELTSVSTTIAASAEQASAQANVVSAAAEQVSRNVQTVATGAEEMGASIREIAQNANEAARVAASAVEVAHATNETVSKLGDSSRQIGEVVKVITSIAEQTNLLALNATIEAARAGEAGKGFAVVANEVKDLAQETAKATEDISRMIQAIQGDTAGAVDAIGQISAVIGQINDYQTTIASAVEEQTATTNEMSRSVAEAATGSTEIAANIIGVAQAAETTSSGVVDSQRAASELAHMSSELNTLVGTFKV